MEREEKQGICPSPWRCQACRKNYYRERICEKRIPLRYNYWSGR